MSGYMAACWRALGKDPSIDVSLYVLWWRMQWDESVTDGLPNFNRLGEQDANNSKRLIELISADSPDVVVVCGWAVESFRALAESPKLRECKFIVAMDTPWRGDFRQVVAPLLLRRFLRRSSLIVVPGEKTWRYASYLTGSDSRLRRGMYGFDFNSFHRSSVARSKENAVWPKQFLFVGRLAEEKCIGLLIEAYRKYRELVDEPWGLTLCGTGKEEEKCRGVEGVHLAGFVQPDELPEIMSEHGAFLLPSRFEPWGVVIAEACASGLPVACTEACGGGLDLIRNYYNGITVPANDADAFCRAMFWMHGHENKLPEMGQRSVEMARPFAAENWAVRWAEYCREAANS